MTITREAIAEHFTPRDLLAIALEGLEKEIRCTGGDVAARRAAFAGVNAKMAIDAITKRRIAAIDNAEALDGFDDDDLNAFLDGPG